MFEQYVVRCGSQTWHREGIVYFKVIGLHAQYILTILGSIVNMIGGLIWPLDEQENLHFDDEQITPVSFKNHEANGHKHGLDL